MTRYKSKMVLLPLFFLATTLSEVFSEDSWVAQVAFKCNKPAMHMTSTGWVTDDKTDCLVEPEDILNYCKKAYPGKDVTNIMESSQAVSFANWCDHGVSTGSPGCSEHLVFPYHCIIGKFQSEPLMVPDGCHYNFTTDEKKCLPEPYWEGVAYEKCKLASPSRGRLESSSMLNPCGIDKFTGVEFVCCPVGKSTPEKGDVIVDDSKDDDDVAARDSLLNVKVYKLPLTSSPKPSHPATAPENKEAESSTPTTPSKLVRVPLRPTSEEEWNDLGFSDDGEDDEEYYDDELFETKAPAATTPQPSDPIKARAADLWKKYISEDNLQSFADEHSKFQAAMSDWRENFSRRLDTLMRDWDEAKAKVDKMAAQDAQAGAKLRADVETQFQRSYSQLQQEGDSERAEMIDTHDQHVRKKLQQKRQKALAAYLTALKSPKLDTDAIIDAVERVVRLEEKERRHGLNFYAHLRETQPSAADTVLVEVQTRLRDSARRIEEAMDLLAKLPADVRRKVKPEIDVYVRSYRDVEQDVHTMMQLLPAKTAHTRKGGFKPLDIEVRNEDLSPQGIQFEEEEGAGVSTGVDKQLDEEVRELIISPDAAPIKAPVSRGGLSRVDTSSAMAVGLGLAALAVLLVAALLIVVKVRSGTYSGFRRVPTGPTLGKVQVSTNVSPEERYVHSMQVRGYENPAYKYFDQGNVA